MRLSEDNQDLLTKWEQAGYTYNFQWDEGRYHFALWDKDEEEMICVDSETISDLFYQAERAYLNIDFEPEIGVLSVMTDTPF